jgi:hypothetical protein
MYAIVGCRAVVHELHRLAGIDASDRTKPEGERLAKTTKREVHG